MRERQTSGSLSVQAVAGTYVVLFGMSVKKAALEGLLGFSIERLDHSTGKRVFLDNFLLFQHNDGAQPQHSSQLNPFQAFVWGDYTAQPQRGYTYWVHSRYGTPEALTTRDSAELDVRTESVDEGTHAIFFNRGAATSQAYALKFPGQLGKRPEGEALAWLSRGLEEALVAFIGKAEGSRFALRGAIYELQYQPVLQAFAKAADGGADVKIVWDDIDNSQPPRDGKPGVQAEPATDNAEAIAQAGIQALGIPRQKSKYIAHNKFIVLLKDGQPLEVWTGSTNITEGGIYGHSNVGHVVRDPEVARHYLGYWNELSGDPDMEPLRDWTVADTTPPARTPEQMLEMPNPLPPDGAIGTVFSPRHGDAALSWYAKVMDEARSSAFMTAAFGVSAEFQEVFKQPKPYLRYLLLDNRKGRIDTIARGIESNPNNEVAAGAYIGEGSGDGWHQWVAEHVTGLNKHVQFIHTKYLLIDPLGDDPIVITGSANFSDASTSENDENMLVIRGDTRVADIYLGEFMRLFTHFRLRGRVNAAPDKLLPAGVPAQQAAQKIYLRPDSSWTDAAYVEGSPEEKERLLFSGTAAAAAGTGGR